VFNDFVFTPQVASLVEEELRKYGRYTRIRVGIRTVVAGSKAFFVTSYLRA
jgi:hypothetical protein